MTDGRRFSILLFIPRCKMKVRTSNDKGLLFYKYIREQCYAKPSLIIGLIQIFGRTSCLQSEG